MLTKNSEIIEVEDISITIIYKQIKNMHLRISQPDGNVSLSAPLKKDINSIRRFCTSKLLWIRKYQEKIKSHQHEPSLEFISGEHLLFLGKLYLLKVIEEKTVPKAMLNYNTIELHVKPNTTSEAKSKIIQQWHKQQINEIVVQFIPDYEKKVNVKVADVRFRKMKSRWGSCNIKSKVICLNTELVKKPIKCIEYVLVHEMVHLLERKHDARFYSFMDKFYPSWKTVRKLLKNQMPDDDEDDID